MELLFKSLIIALGLATIPAFGMVPQNKEAQELPLHKQIDQLPPELKVHILSYRPKKSSPALDFWLSKTGKKIPAYNDEMFGRMKFCSAEFSPDSSTLVTAPESHSNPIKVWNTNTQKLICTIDHSDREFTDKSLANFSPDGKRMVTVRDRFAKVWSRGLFENTLDLTLEHKERDDWTCTLEEKDLSSIHSVQFSHDGTHIMTASKSDAKLWDAHTGALIGSFNTTTGEDTVSSCLKSAQLTSDKKVITVCDNDTATIHDPTGKTPSRILSKLEGLCPKGFKYSYYTTPQFNHNGTKAIISFRYAENALVYDTLTNTIEHTLKHSDICAARFSPDGTRIISSSEYTNTKIWDTRTGRCLHTIKACGTPEGGSSAIALSPDNMHSMIIEDRCSEMKLYNLQLISALNHEDRLFLIHAYWCHKFRKPIDLSNPKLQKSFENLHPDLQEAVRSECILINEPIMSRFLNNVKSLFK